MKKTRFRMMAGAAVIGLALTLIPANTAMAGPVTNPCAANVVVIGVRGTDAPKGTGLIQSNNLWSSGGLGDTKSVVDKWAASGWGVFTASLNYQASGGVAYPASLSEGRDRLGSFLNSLTSCAVRPAVVLVGHSQGASVVAHTLAASFVTTAAKDMVKAAIMFGDPSFQGNKNYVTSPPPGSGVLGPRGANIEAVLTGPLFYKWGWPQYGSQMGYASKIRSYCIAGDWACTGAPMNATSSAIHVSYGAVKGTDAFQWSQYMLSQF